ncbi:MAG: hypothetical protein GX562_00830 [Coriobacteriaceae bacterium]|nr:hypothetical protein [Coriobacteriaceae bacterium]
MNKNIFNEMRDQMKPNEQTMEELREKLTESTAEAAPADTTIPLVEKLAEPSAPEPPHKKTTWLRSYGAAAAAILLVMIGVGAFAFNGILNKPSQPDIPSSSSPSSEQPASSGLIDEVVTSSYDELFQTIQTFFTEQEQRYGLGTAVAQGVTTLEDNATGGAKEGSSIDGSATAPTGSSDIASTAESSAGLGGDYSQTNVQVEGIDEGDIVKTDGEYIYAFMSQNYDNNEIVIFSAQGADSQEVGRISLNDLAVDEYIRPIEMYIDGDTLALIHESNWPMPVEPLTGEPMTVEPMINDGGGTSGSEPAAGSAGGTSAGTAEEVGTAPDTTTSSEPAIDSMSIGLPYYSSQTAISLIDIADPTQPILRQTFNQSGYYTSSRMSDGIVYLLTNYGIYDYRIMDSEQPLTFVPWYGSVAGTEAIEEAKILPLPVEDISILPEFSYPNYSVICSIDLASNKRVDQQTVLGGTETTYMTDEDLYLGSSVYEVETSEPYQESVYTITEYTNRTSTQLIRIALDTGAMTPESQGKIPGILLNQFSLDEYQDHLRAAVTVNEYSYKVLVDAKMGVESTQSMEGPPQTNALFVLDKDLVAVGSLEGLAEEQRIYSARFMGDVGYVVTFRQIDPLYAIDLSDPSNPTLMSALKIPGFSTYLHPYSEGRLLGLGQDDVTGNIKLSMFDTSDPYNVTERFTLQVPGGWSEALYNHKAAIVNFEHNLIGFGVDQAYLVYGYDDESGFSLRLQVDYTLEDNEIYKWMYQGRGLYVGSEFYVVRPPDVDIYTLDSLEAIKALDL